MIRVFVSDDFMHGGPAIIFAREHAGDINTPAARYIMQLGEGGLVSWQQYEEAVVMRPTLRLSDDEGRALLEALTRHYHGADDSRALRRDYDSERQRVDKLTDAVCGLAATLAQPPEPVPQIAVRSHKSLNQMRGELGLPRLPPSDA